MNSDSESTVPDDLPRDPDAPWYYTPFLGRLVALLLPPLGLMLLWANPFLKLKRRVLGTVLLLAYSLLYAILAVAILEWAGLVAVEWKGGFGPSLVGHKTGPDYGALDRHRSMRAPEDAGTAPAPTTVPSTYWTAFRGPRFDGHYEEEPIATNWTTRPPLLLWKQPCGGGYASFVVVEDRVITLEQRRDDEAVVAYDLQTGREVWSHRYPASFREWMGGDGPRATPVYRDGLVYSLGATGELCCLGVRIGRLIWQKNILTENEAENLTYGMAASPVIVDSTLVVLTGKGSPGRSVVAYHRLSGERVWSAHDDKQAYTTPILVELAGSRQLLVVSARRVMGLQPADGALLWEWPWRVEYDNAITPPVVVGPSRFFISAGYGAGCALVEIERTNDLFTARTVWRNHYLKTKFNPAVYWQGHVYGLDEGVLACIDVETGERKWRSGRYGYGQLLLATGHLVILTGEGTIVLVRADPRALVEVARVSALKGKTWNVPALAGGRLLVRNGAEMACYDVRAGDESRRLPSRLRDAD